jgi:hypothetical protein
MCLTRWSPLRGWTTLFAREFELQRGFFFRKRWEPVGPWVVRATLWELTTVRGYGGWGFEIGKALDEGVKAHRHYEREPKRAYTPPETPLACGGFVEGAI